MKDKLYEFTEYKDLGDRRILKMQYPYRYTVVRARNKRAAIEKMKGLVKPGYIPIYERNIRRGKNKSTKEMP